MRAYEAVKYWSEFLINNNITESDRVLVVEDDSLLDDIALYSEAFFLKENCINPIIAIPDFLSDRVYSWQRVLFFDVYFFKELVALPSQNQLRENLTPCALYERGVGKLLGIHTINDVATEVTQRDIIAQGILGLRNTPTDEEIDELKRVYLNLDKSLDTALLSECIPPRNTQYSFLDYALYNTEKLVEKGIVGSVYKVYLFGKTMTALRICEYLESCNIDVEAILDNRATPGEYYANVRVISPRELPEANDLSNTRILIPLKSYLSACAQLYSYGYTFGKNIYVVSNVSRSSLMEYNQLQQTSDKLCEQAIESLNRLREQYKNTTINICPYRGSGDVFLICRYLQMDSELNNRKNVIVVSSDVLSEVASILAVDAVVLSRDEILNISDWFYFAQKENTRLLDINITSSIGQRVHGINGLSYNVMLHCMLFPELPFSFEVQLEQKPINNSDGRYLLDKDKTIILSPYANTMGQLSNELWIDIAKNLKKKGYIIYTNVAGDEKPIEGTEGIKIPFASIIWCMNRCKAFIGLRSGLCDIISQASCTMVVIYNGHLVNGTSLFQLYSLRNMGIRDTDLYEIDYQDGDGWEWIEKI